eukprot:GHUV01029033.1.p3 GENE.GHUV01029033.1~~GHUV01029033.1.p3  ORF type:complete len:114 (+),score=3.21 GHUV01029033.1:296-637(+)
MTVAPAPPLSVLDRLMISSTYVWPCVRPIVTSCIFNAISSDLRSMPKNPNRVQHSSRRYSSDIEVSPRLRFWMYFTSNLNTGLVIPVLPAGRPAGPCSALTVASNCFMGRPTS